MTEKPAWDDSQWRDVLLNGGQKMKGLRRLFRALPSAPRCGLCLGPFAGVGGRLFRLSGFAPSRKNPRYCNECFESAPHGGAAVDVGILFADMRGYTNFSESRAPEEVVRLLNRFYRMATDVLSTRGAIIDKLVGDEVMAIFVPGLAGEAYVEQMVSAAEDLLHGAGFGGQKDPWIALGVGLDHGIAYVGNVGADEVKDFTAIGDVVNTAARLQGQAREGHLIMSDSVHSVVPGRYPGAEAIELDLRGKTDLVHAWVVDFRLT